MGRIAQKELCRYTRRACRVRQRRFLPGGTCRVARETPRQNHTGSAVPSWVTLRSDPGRVWWQHHPVPFYGWVFGEWVGLRSLAPWSMTSPVLLLGSICFAIVIAARLLTPYGGSLVFEQGSFAFGILLTACLLSIRTPDLPRGGLVPEHPRPGTPNGRCTAALNASSRVAIPLYVPEALPRIPRCATPGDPDRSPPHRQGGDSRHARAEGALLQPAHQSLWPVLRSTAEGERKE